MAYIYGDVLKIKKSQ